MFVLICLLAKSHEPLYELKKTFTAFHLCALAVEATGLFSGNAMISVILMTLSKCKQSWNWRLKMEFAAKHRETTKTLYTEASACEMSQVSLLLTCLLTEKY